MAAREDVYHNQRQQRKLSDAALALLEMRKHARCPFCHEVFFVGEREIYNFLSPIGRGDSESRGLLRQGGKLCRQRYLLAYLWNV